MAGNGRIENLKPFKPGQSGNPGGRPKKRPITDEYFADSQLPMSAKDCKRLGLPKGSTFAQGHARQRNLDGIKPQGHRASKEMREAMEGKAPMRLEITGQERREVTIRVIHETKQ
jgi:hypothetical protein